MTDDDFFDRLYKARARAIELEAEADSIRDRMREISAGSDDYSRAATKLRHTRERLVAARQSVAEMETELDRRRQG